MTVRRGRSRASGAMNLSDCWIQSNDCAPGMPKISEKKPLVGYNVTNWSQSIEDLRMLQEAQASAANVQLDHFARFKCVTLGDRGGHEEVVVVG